METSLYLPIKAFLEALDFTVKGEIGGCDVLGLREGEQPVLVVCELKQSFNLELVLQAVHRAAACDEVWLAARVSARGKGRESDARFRNLCRRLGFGMLAVTDAGDVQILVTPQAPFPRKETKRRSRLLAEHRKRRGDPVTGGSTRIPQMTAYRQGALACAHVLVKGPERPRNIAREHGIPDALKFLSGNVYGWFIRIEKGVYGLTDIGQQAVERWPKE